MAKTKIKEKVGKCKFINQETHKKCKKDASSPTSKFCTAHRGVILRSMRESGYLDGWDPRMHREHGILSRGITDIDEKIREAFTTKVKLEEVGSVD